MKTIEFRRHSKKTGHGNVNLSEEGRELARQVGEEELRGQSFTHLYVSALQRTIDTMEAFEEGAGDFPSVDPVLFLAGSDVFGSEDAMKLWEGVCNEAERSGEDMMRAAIENDPDRAERIAGQATLVFKKWVEALPDDAHALVVNHSPAMELITYGIFGIVLPQLQPCEGFSIIFDGEYRLVK